MSNISIDREDYRGLLFHYVGHSNAFSISNLCTLQLAHFTITLQTGFLTNIYTAKPPGPRADGAKRRARVLIPPGYLHPGKRKH
jgi:hypothetical protein